MNNTAKSNICPKCGVPIPAGAPQGLCPKCVLRGAATATDAGVPATATSEIPSLERIAKAFPQLQILDLIGRGGMGFVFKARQPHLDRFVALKLLPDKLAKDAQFTERFNREGRVLARLNHPNIVSVFDFGQTGGFYYLLMEFVDGVNLRQAMRAGRFSPAEALALVPKVCEALQYAHEQGILHRDIKPENILLDTKGRVKIADFGIAKLVGEDHLGVTLTNTGAALGTPHYMAPEQLEKPSTVDHRADIYSLGVVFYEMLTGELPIGRFAAPSSKTPVGVNVDEVVFRTLEKEPGKRFQSAGEVQTRVQDLADEASAAAQRGPANPPAAAPLGPHGTVVLADATPVFRERQAVAGVRRLNLLAWVLASVFAVGIGMVMVNQFVRSPATPRSEAAVEPLIQFTFTSVELRELAGARWLGLDYVQQIQGACERMFRTDSTVPGFKFQIRTSESLAQGDKRFAPVRRQRVEWKLPDSLSQAETEAYRKQVARQWEGKSVVIEPGDSKTLFTLTMPEGGTCSGAIGVRLSDVETGTPPKAALGSVKLIGAGEYRNFALARIESMPGHPLHQVVARFAGPGISEQVAPTLSAISGPKLVPSPDEDMATPAEPVDGSILWGTNRAPIASAIGFECPGDYSLQFVLPDENLARDAARQMNETLARPLSLIPGRPVPLFNAGQWKGWLETRPFKPEPNRFAFFKHPGLSPAQIPGTNRIESAVATIPPGHELTLKGSLTVNGVIQRTPVFSTTLTSGPNEAGIYWFTWYLVPNPQRLDLGPKTNWELQIHDALGQELLRSQAPDGLDVLWHKKWVGDEPISVRAGKPIKAVFFEKAHVAGDRGPTMLLLEMTMQRAAAVGPDR